jgi:hypothetical protein
MKLVGKPDAGNRHVRFDERGQETECCHMAQATARLSSTLHGLGGQNETAQFHYAYGWGGGVAVSWVRARAEGAAGGCTPLIGNADMGSFQKELREGLRELGYTEGHNIAFEFRSAEGILDRLPALAAELVRLKVDVIAGLGRSSDWRSDRPPSSG